ncbi:GNAT family N-acetyltransferase [Candidatus Bathyarchaeota archaeon]|nr:GNAT family N-acetyltransferase [Candidatus Bathyarchaeota archaeon]
MILTIFVIRNISHSELNDFIQCYIDVFQTLYDILPNDYVSKQIEDASTPKFHKYVEEQLENQNNVLLLSYQNKKVTGIVWGNIQEDAAWLGFMGVKDSYRGQGIGRSLLNRFIHEVKNTGAQKVSLDTDPSLVPAIRLYESDGFTKEGTVVNPHGMELVLYTKKLN